MAIDIQVAAQTAAEYAEAAASVAGTLKPGSYEAVQALAIVSIAHSLAVLAERARNQGGGGA
jgi:hypothetical protein